MSVIFLLVFAILYLKVMASSVAIGRSLLRELDRQSDRWGVKVTQATLRDIFPTSIIAISD